MQRFLMTVAALGLSVAATAANAQSVDATIDRAIAAWGKIKTVRGTFEQTVSNPITSATAIGTKTSASG